MVRKRGVMVDECEVGFDDIKTGDNLRVVDEYGSYACTVVDVSSLGRKLHFSHDYEVTWQRDDFEAWHVWRVGERCPGPQVAPTQECLEYAAKKGKAYCIAQCSDARIARAITAMTDVGRSAKDGIGCGARTAALSASANVGIEWAQRRREAPMAENQTLIFIPRSKAHPDECVICGKCGLDRKAVVADFHPNDTPDYCAVYCLKCVGRMNSVRSSIGSHKDLPKGGADG